MIVGSSGMLVNHFIDSDLGIDHDGGQTWHTEHDGGQTWQTEDIL